MTSRSQKSQTAGMSAARRSGGLLTQPGALRWATLAALVLLAGCQSCADDPGPPSAEPEPEPEACIEGQELCEGECVNVVDDVAHCGGCDPCAEIPGAAVDCRNSACVYGCLGGAVDANGDLGQDDSDGCECTPGQDICDGVDNNCDGATDEDNPTLLVDCTRAPNTEAVACEAGVCIHACQEGFVDLNADLNTERSDGCECVVSPELCDGLDNDCDGAIDADDPDLPPADELCDGLDNDCDGLTDADDPDLLPADELCDGIDNDCDDLTDADDPDLDLARDCGATTGAQATCLAGACAFACADDLVDVNGDLDLGPDGDGCECQPTTPSTETCDNIDNDCDGQIDADDPDAPDLLDNCPTANNASPVSCADGACTLACDQGFFDVNADLNQPNSDGCECQPTTPSTETCDAIDNDCDGAIDANDPDFNLSTCPAVPGAQAQACVQAACTFACATGFVDINGDLAQGPNGDGCECQRDNPSTEFCDGIDNDCDGQIDADDNDFTPDLCALQQGVCQDATALCLQGQSVDCDEARYLNNDATSTGLDDTLELVCDGLDNNCDGDDDEACCPEDQGIFAIAEPFSTNLNQILPAIASNNDHSTFIVAWQESASSNTIQPTNTGFVRWRLIGPEGAPQSPTGTLNSDFIEDIQPTVGFNGQDFFMIWVKEGVLTDTLTLVRIGLNGQVIGQPLDIVRQNIAPLSLRDPALLRANDGRLLLLWSQGGDCTNTSAESCIRASTLAQNGTLGPITELSEANGAIRARSPSAFLDGDFNMLVWHDIRPGSSGVKSLPLSQQFQPLGPIQNTPLNDNDLISLPSIVRSGNGAILALSDQIGETFQLKTGRLNSAGQLVGQLNTLTNGSNNKSSPRLVPLDGGAGLFWVEGRALFFQRIDDLGLPAGLPLPLAQDRGIGFEPVALLPLSDAHFAVASSIENPIPVKEAVQFRLLNAEGQGICLP